MLDQNSKLQIYNILNAHLKRSCFELNFGDPNELDMSDELKARIKKILVENLMLQISPEEIQDDTALFAAEGLKLDSIDALELTVAIEKNFGVVTPNAQVAKEAFVSVNTIAHYILKNMPHLKE